MKYNNNLLNKREMTHGDYLANATLSQKLKANIRHHVLTELPKDQRESLDLICTKIGRICTGNPNEVDHWKDIAGYAELVVSRLERRRVICGGGGKSGVSNVVYSNPIASDIANKFKEQAQDVVERTERETVCQPDTDHVYSGRSGMVGRLDPTAPVYVTSDKRYGGAGNSNSPVISTTGESTAEHHNQSLPCADKSPSTVSLTHW